MDVLYNEQGFVGQRGLVYLRNEGGLEMIPPPRTTSLAGLMACAFSLALELAFSTRAPDGSYMDTRDDLPDGDLADKVWCWADGLMSKYYEKHTSGRCSLSALISFDVAEFEKEVRADLAAFRNELRHVTPCRAMTFDEMKARGYRGSWAGYTEEEDRIFYLKRDREGLAIAMAQPETSYDDMERKRAGVAYFTSAIAKAGGRA